jgi:murein DD-endopeptidase MepM/ murein hydrolase activator NlpD
VNSASTLGNLDAGPGRRARRRAASTLAGLLAAKLTTLLGPLCVLLLAVTALFGPPTPEATGGPLRYGASAFALRDIPADYLRHYQDAEQRYGVEWAILAGIGKVESDHGRLHAPGVTSGQNSHGCCAGPMQFFTNRAMTGGQPTTWDSYGVDANGDGRKDPYDPADAIHAAGNYLKALGAERDVRQALFGYNHAWWYVDQVEAWARRYRGALTEPPAAGLPDDVGQLAWPVRGTVVSPFGPRCLAGVCRPHQGIDIAVPAGTPVHASAAGRVVLATVMSGYGNFLCIAHTRRLTTCYAHLTSFSADLGERVHRGDVVATSGCTGRCFGDHVHFEVHRAATWSHASATDPQPYLRATTELADS